MIEVQRSNGCDAANDRPSGRIAGWRAALELSPTGSDAFDAAFDALVEARPTYRNAAK